MLSVAFRAATGVSVGRMGILMSAGAFGAIVGMLPAGFAHDRMGSRVATVLAGSWALVGLGGLGVFLPRGFWPLLILVFLVGSALPALSLVGLGSVSTLFQGTPHEGLALGVRQASAPLGGVLAASLLPWLGHVWPLQRVFLALSVNLALWTVILTVFLPVRRAISAPRPSLRLRHLFVHVRGALWTSFLLAPGQYALLTYVIFDLHDKAGRHPVAAGLLLAVALLSGLLSRLVLGSIHDRGVAVTRLLRLAAGVGATSLLLWAGLPRDLPLTALVLIFMALGAGVDGWNALLTAWLAEKSRTAERGLGLALVGMAGLFGVIVWIPVLGILQRVCHSYRPGWVVVAALYALAAFTLARPATPSSGRLTPRAPGP